MAMNEFPEQVKNILKNLTFAKTAVLLVVLGCTVTAFVFIMMWSTRGDMQVLFSNLTPEDAGAVLSRLKEQKIPYRISGNGNSVLIPRDRVYETRLDLAAQGLPQGGAIGFEIFDNTKLGMTEFVQNVNYQRALQGELARTINGFSEVESCRVHVVMPSKSLFVEEEEPATASVVLKLRSGRWLTNDQIQGIVHLVSSSVSGLNPKHVTVVDNYGKMLAGENVESDLGRFSSDQLMFQEKVEKNLEHRIKTMLEKALGPDRAVVRLACAMDFKRYEKTEEIYDPETRVVRSEQLTNENSAGWETVPVGIPGVVSNVAGFNMAPDSLGQTSGFEMMSESMAPPSGYQKQDKTINYEISKVTSHTIEPVGKIERVSVAVLVDGTYKMSEGEKGAEELKYFPRTDEEMTKLESIVKSAIDFDPARGDKVEVVNIPFESGPMPHEEDVVATGWVHHIKRVTPFLRYGFVSVFLLLAFVFVVRPLMHWLTASGASEMELLNHLPRTVGEVEQDYMQDGKSLPHQRRALEMITKDSDSSAKVMQEWLKES
jgi:flagellar M-ring protein FliF